EDGRLPLGADVTEVGRLDDESVSFPTAAGVPQPLLDAGADVRTPIQGYDPYVVDHLDRDHDVAGRLEDLVVVVVEPRHHRAWQAAGNAPLVGTTILGLVGDALVSSLSLERMGERRLDFLSFRGERRQTPVFRLHEQRRSIVRERIAGLEPNGRRIPG